MNKSLVVVTLLGICSSDAFAWETAIDNDGILVETRLKPNFRYREFRAKTETSGTIAQAIALLKDTTACKRWLYRCENSYVIRELSSTERLFYQLTSLPFPAKSRENILHAKITFEGRARATITMTSSSQELPVTKNIRVKKALGVFLLESTDENTLKVIWQQYIDPGGTLPSWIINSMISKVPYKSLQAFRDLIKESPYSDAILINGSDGAPTDIRSKDTHN